MLKKLSALWEKWSTDGLRVPFIWDATTNKPSMTLMFPYIGFLLCIISLIALHFSASLFLATATTIGFWVLGVVFYLMRRIQKMRLDLDDKEIELEGGEGDNN